MAHIRFMNGESVIVNKEVYDKLYARFFKDPNFYKMENGECIRFEAVAFLSPFNSRIKNPAPKRRKRTVKPKPKPKQEVFKDLEDEGTIEISEAGKVEESS